MTSYIDSSNIRTLAQLAHSCEDVPMWRLVGYLTKMFPALNVSLSNNACT